MAGPRLPVNPPTFTPGPYGLLTVVQSQPTTDKHWQNGVTFEPICLATGMGSTTYDECLAVTGTPATPAADVSPPAPPAKSDNVEVPHIGATPFTVFVEYDCSTVGNPDYADVVKDALTRVEGWQVERAFWTGTAGGQKVVLPHLAATAEIVDAQDIILQTPVVTGGGPFKPARALGVLEGLLGDCYYGVATVHVPQAILPIFANAPGSIFKNGAQLQTMNGNLVAVGAGYPGTGPDGSAPPSGSMWIYGTGPVMMWRGDVRTFAPTEQIDRSKNTVKAIAERTYVLGWGCCHFAVLVDLT